MHLNVNVDHIATIRQARGVGQREPDPVRAAREVERAGGHGITVHLREDRRHIQDHDIRRLREAVKTKLNMEMAIGDEMVRLALAFKPEWVTLVTERRSELTTEGGMDLRGKVGVKVGRVIERLSKGGRAVSVFIDPNLTHVRHAKAIGAQMVELHTGTYASAKHPADQDKEFSKIIAAAREAASLGMKVNAGHGLDYLNVRRVAGIADIQELSIGHSIVSRAVYAGMYEAVVEMLRLMKEPVQETKAPAVMARVWAQR